MAKTACPNCGGSIIIGKKNYFCENFRPTGDPDDCNFILWKNDLEKFGKGEISDNEMIKLLSGDMIPLKLKSSKSGKKFECDGELTEMDCNDGKKRWKVQFKFEERKQKVLGETEAGEADEDAPAF